MLKELVIKTLTQPMEAAREIIGFAIKREALWMALVLVALLNAIQFSLTFQFAGTELPAGLAPDERALWEFFIGMAQRPFVFTLILSGSLVISVFVLNWVGLMLGGQGGLRTVLTVVTWWQLLGFAIGLVILALSFVSIGLASLFNMVTNIWLLYVLSGLLAGAHHFKTPLGGLGTIVLSVIFLAVGLAVALVILGVGSGLGGANV